MSRRADEYEAEIAGLRAELDRLRSAPFITGTLAVGLRRSSLTVAGAEEMLLEVRVDDTIGYINRPMAVLLGVDDRKAVIGTPLAHFDRGPIGPGVLSGIVQVARGATEPQILERLCPDLGWSRLPATSGERPTADPMLRFVATAHEGRVQITCQDVTRLRWLEATFSRYVPPSVIEQMSQMAEADFRRTERRELTILFGDLRGFTSLSQNLAPEQVLDVVNGFLGNMVQCVERLGGTVDKFMGDGIMAIFGAPVAYPDHALRALVCAVEMQRAHSEWVAAGLAEGRPVARLGVGCATGPVVVGNIGPPSRVDYTVLGHIVNLAARLCGSAGGGDILTTRETHAHALAHAAAYAGAVPLPRLGFEPKGRMPFKHVSEPIDVIAVTRKS
jgi:class 3 adenylate cyclase